MALTLQITSGARAGQRVEFTRPVVLAGRHAESDLKFDPQKDLDVSTKHAEFRSGGGGWTVHDLGSTNGTFVNGLRINGPQAIRAGDSLSFGEKGPRVEVVAAGEATAGVAPATVQRPSTGMPRPKTEERIAMAVAKQTGSMKKVLIGLAVVVVVGGGYLVMQNNRLSADSRRMIAALQAQNDSLANVSAGKSAGLDSVIQDLKRQRDQMVASIRSGGDVNQKQFDELNRRTQGVMSARSVDWVPVGEKNNNGVAYIFVQAQDGTASSGTAFGITPGGMLATNRHVVLDHAGKPVKRIVVTFADTKDWQDCHLVTVASGDVDIAFVQIDKPGNSYPVVQGIAANPALRAGQPVAILGFPLGKDLPMEGSGVNLTPRTTMTVGIVSKSLVSDLQLDAYSAEGASGSPVFDARGLVIGVVYGGNRESGGRVVFAVPGAQLVAALPAAAKSILK